MSYGFNEDRTKADFSNFISKADLEKKADKATTLSGYGITDAYNQTQTEDKINQAISRVYKFKGSVNNFGSLPTSNRSVGDVWNVIAANGNIPAGTNYAWTGGAWDALGGEIDLSKLVEKEAGKGLSSNDYTAAEKQKLANINLSDLVTKESLANELNGIDLDNYVTKESLANELNGIDLDNYVTKESLANELDNIDLSNYVTKEVGKQLSSNDYTNEDKQKLNDINLSELVTINALQTSLSNIKNLNFRGYLQILSYLNSVNRENYLTILKELEQEAKPGDYWFIMYNHQIIDGLENSNTFIAIYTGMFESYSAIHGWAEFINSQNTISRTERIKLDYNVADQDSYQWTGFMPWLFLESPIGSPNGAMNQHITSSFFSEWVTKKAVKKDSPSFTGTPTAPTAIIGTNTTQIATTAFVQQELAALGGSISYQVVDTLPSTGSIGVIYLVANQGPSGNIYDEYIWAGVSGSEAFEKIGTTEPNLSDYVQSSSLEEISTSDIQSTWNEVINA